jgi:thymidylate synthase (FAD)
MVVAAARVSTNGDECLQYADPALAGDNWGLIKYLVKHRHGTPFEHSFMTFYVQAPICVWREWHRHRIGFSYNEESGRYKQLDPVFYIPERDRLMMKVDNWKPGRPKFLPCEDGAKYNGLISRLTHSYQVAYDAYEENLADGFDPGLARDCLPVGIFSGCWVSCNPRSLMAFLSLRTHEPEALFVSYPLWEIEVAARATEEIFAQGWPLTYRAFCENGRVAP